jgi:hypothetical protein
MTDARTRVARWHDAEEVHVGFDFHLHEWSGQPVDVVQRWQITYGAYDNNEDLVDKIADIEIAICELDHPELWYLLDGISSSYEDVASAVLDPDTGDLRDELHEMSDFGYGSHLMIPNTMEMADDYRHGGLGPVILGIAMSRLQRGCGLAAIKPAPLGPGTLDGKTFDDGVSALGRTWSKLGFEHFRDGIWVLDFALVTFDEHLRSLVEPVSDLF